MSYLSACRQLPAHGRLLISAEQIQQRIRELALEISTTYAGQSFQALALMNGALFFVADLLREVEADARLLCVRLASYEGTQSSGKVDGLHEIDPLRAQFRNRPVLVIDDILDTGRTLAGVVTRLQALGATDVKTCVLLEKKQPRTLPVRADWVGFTIGQEFVIGYGLDYDGQYRQLRDIFELRAEEGIALPLATAASRPEPSFSAR